MNRTDRLYAIVESLRAASPDATSARSLAERFEVSTRTIERDILALQEAGVPIYADPGRRGGYHIDASRTLPPVNFTPAEAASVAAALSPDAATPLPFSARSALAKIMAAMSVESVADARSIGTRLVRYEPAGRPLGDFPRIVEQAIVDRRVLVIDYEDRHGEATKRTVEPIALIGVQGRWYLVAWCRMRVGQRGFRLDRITNAVLTREVAPERDLEDIGIELEPRSAFPS
jgi:predicted DNA-binding transcriptional regulator YafY